MKTISKNLKTALLSLLFLSIIAISSVLLVGCGGDDIERDVTKLDGIIDTVQTTTVSDNGEITGFALVFLTEPSEFSATYNDAVIEAEVTTIEDYNNNGLIVSAYKYAFSFDSTSEESYNLSPIHVSVTVSEQQYEFDLTSDLLERIYPSLAWVNKFKFIYFSIINLFSF